MQLYIFINPLASPSAGAPALKYGDVNTVTPSPGEVKGLINDDNWVKIINKKNERKRYFNIKYDL